MVDNESDLAIQRALRTAFKNVVVITIAHRLKTVIDCDVVVVLSRGRIVEAGPPHLLLLEHDGDAGEARAIFEAAKAKALRARLPVFLNHDGSSAHRFSKLVDECGAAVAGDLKRRAESAFMEMK